MLSKADTARGEVGCDKVGDSRIVKMCLDGDSLAWELLIDRNRDRIMWVMGRCGVPESDHDDVFQDISLKLWNRLHTLKDPGMVYAWVITIARNTSLDFLKTQPPPAEPEEEAHGIADPAPGVDQLLAELQRRDAVRKAVEKIGEPCASIVRMLCLQPVPATYKEVAGKVNKAEGTIGAQKARCFDKLRSELRKLGFVK